MTMTALTPWLTSNGSSSSFFNPIPSSLIPPAFRFILLKSPVLSNYGVLSFGPKMLFLTSNLSSPLIEMTLLHDRKSSFNSLFRMNLTPCYPPLIDELESLASFVMPPIPRKFPVCNSPSLSRLEFYCTISKALSDGLPYWSEPSIAKFLKNSWA